MTDADSEEDEPLTVLPVVREIFCDQKTTDACIEFIQTEWPDVIERLIFTSQEVPENFFEVLETISSNLRELAPRRDIPLPEGYLGMLDLLFELARRFEHDYGWPWVKPPEDIRFKPRGSPLSKNFTPPPPPLVNLAISERNLKKGLKQEDVDKILEAFYRQHPELWIERAEELRLHLGLMARTQHKCLDPLEKLLLAANKIPDMQIDYQYLHEMDRRISLMCDLPFKK